MLFYGSLELIIYGLASMVLWFVVEYNWWVRLMLAVRMVLFATGFMPGIFSRKFHSGISGMVVCSLLCFAIECVAYLNSLNMAFFIPII